MSYKKTVKKPCQNCDGTGTVRGGMQQCQACYGFGTQKEVTIIEELPDESGNGSFDE